MSTIDPRETLKLLASSVNELLGDEALQHANPGEVALTTALAQHMVPYFNRWSVCAEWDRKGQEKKMLYFGFQKQVAKLRAIRPDIIVHHIGNNDENILVVEAKRSKNPERAKDIAKLKAMTSTDGGYIYDVGVRLMLDLPRASVPECEVFRNGDIDAELTDDLRRQLPNLK